MNVCLHFFRWQVIDDMLKCCIISTFCGTKLYKWGMIPPCIQKSLAPFWPSYEEQSYMRRSMVNNWWMSRSNLFLCRIRCLWEQKSNIVKNSNDIIIKLETFIMSLFPSMLPVISMMYISCVTVYSLSLFPALALRYGSASHHTKPQMGYTQFFYAYSQDIVVPSWGRRSTRPHMRPGRQPLVLFSIFISMITMYIEHIFI
jgi:hypothetical protein